MKVTFIPKAGTKYDETGWPEEVRGDGFIDLKLWDTDTIADLATYRDQYSDEYEFYGVDEGEWDADVREDG